LGAPPLQPCEVAVGDNHELQATKSHRPPCRPRQMGDKKEVGGEADPRTPEARPV